MNLKSFFSLVEIRTKVASMLPLMIGTLYVVFRFNSFNPLNFIFFFLSLIFIDMATTALNHFYDFKKAKNEYGYNYNIHNPVKSYNLSNKNVITIIIILLTTAVISGLILYLRTDLLILLIGALSFFVGITYSFGPIPISRTPLGELFSGIFMGFFIFFIATQIHLPPQQKIINLIYQNYNIIFEIHIIELIFIFCASLPLILSIANIMLANNISDIEDDKKNDRYTLPIYIGKKNALFLFKTLYYIIFLDFIFLIALKIVPLFSLIIFVSLIPVYKNIQTFMQKQTKKDTFNTCIENFLWINGLYLLSFLLFFLF
ncbi:MAG: 1,4-dihydroxy-2-naphthoate polyprenyltransferase [Halanaerobiales bacterium]